jgi:transcriptional regulator GlxA family with amidase domain
MTRTVAILIFDEVEVLDVGGPFEVFSTASRVRKRLQPDQLAPFEVFTVAETFETVRARAGLKLMPHFAMDAHPAIDVLVVPGGVVTAAMQRENVIQWISRIGSQAPLTASVCTGAFLLAKAGLLDGRPATTHWEDLEDLRSQFPSTQVVSDQRWVDTGSIVTSAGISAGIDMCLHLVARLEGIELANLTARQMEWVATAPQ